MSNIDVASPGACNWTVVSALAHAKKLGSKRSYEHLARKQLCYHASKYVRILCGVHIYCCSTHSIIASRKTEVLLAMCRVFVVQYAFVTLPIEPTLSPPGGDAAYAPALNFRRLYTFEACIGYILNICQIFIDWIYWNVLLFLQIGYLSKLSRWSRCPRHREVMPPTHQQMPPGPLEL